MAKGTKSNKSNPFDMSEFMKLYDPEKIGKMFDPSTFIGQLPASAPDMSELLERNRRNYEAMVEANKAAAETYRDMLEKQTEIWNRMTEAAREYASQVEASGSAEAMTKSSEAYAQAVETSLALMQEMAETARKANEKAFSDMQERVSEAIKEMKPD